ncbi:MAG: hypothetical protein KGL39_35455 [Patescibacteria group bacterium]|nr:hypothetical protein [Patescibacteria group bacterium]
MKPELISLECTPRGWVWTVYGGGKVIATRRVHLDRHGATGHTTGDLAAILADQERLLDGIDDCNPLTICRSLLGGG